MNFFSDVDAHRAPGNAAAATNTAGRSKLIDPRGQLVGEPLTISGAGAGPDITAVDVRKIEVEAGIPQPPSLGVFAI